MTDIISLKINKNTMNRVKKIFNNIEMNEVNIDKIMEMLKLIYGDQIDNILLSDNFNLKMDNTICNSLIYTQYILVKGILHNNEYTFLFDTGSNVNLIFDESIKNKKINNLVDYSIKTDIHGLNSKDKILGFLGNKKIYFRNANEQTETFNLDLLITKKKEIEIKFDGIIGIDFMKMHKISIDFNKNCVIFKNNFEINFE